MASAEKFCLRWNDFEANISSAFRELREDKDFFDVTLACDDDQIQAHKVILSACSPFFRTVLRRNRHEHPLLYLKGVKYVDLVAVLNFMYHGEVNVAQEELNSFLAVAEDLKVKGLTQNNSEKNTSSSRPPEPPRSRPRDPPERPDPLPPPKRPRPSPQQFTPSSKPPAYQQDDDDIQEVLPVKSEPVSLAPDPILNNSGLASVSEQQPASDFGVQGVVADPSLDTSSMYGGDEYADYGNYEEGDGSLLGGVASADGNKEHVVDLSLLKCFSTSNLDDEIEQKMMRVVGGPGEGVMYSCKVCLRKYKDKTKMKHHIETHLDSFQVCPICKQHCKTRRTLKTHIARTHSNMNFAEHIIIPDISLSGEPNINLPEQISTPKMSLSQDSNRNINLPQESNSDMILPEYKFIPEISMSHE